MNSLQKEYDRFGPWLLEVHCQEDVPPLFREYYMYDASKVKMVLKIPVKIERRNANPGDVLYNSLVSFGHNEVVVYELKEKRVSEKRITYADIYSIQNCHNLLKGELIFFAKSGKEIIQYNTVSHRIIDQVVDFLRIEYLKDSEDFFQPHRAYVAKITNHLFQNLLNEMEQREQINILGFQPILYLELMKKKWYEYIWDIYNKYMLQNTMFLENGKELIVISKQHPLKRRLDTDYSYIHTYIPFKNIQDVHCVANEKFMGIIQLKFKMEGEILSFFVNQKLKIDELLPL
ncbi:MAG: hypothetical protein CVV02_12840 [Firmicutes bacterium HGW-Firmicutes-7]|nr:MAG: hypothetical protein CVV02_12840 [Firmicutes bacterium HGW-Firmicutes-7]